MKHLLRLKFFLLIQTFPLLLLAQEISDPPQPDEGMDLFLLIMGSLFIAAMFGAAIIGAFCAALAALFFVGLFSFGIITASFTIGLYKRSVSAGFRSLMLLFFGTTCSLSGWLLFSFFNKLIPLDLTSLQASLIGLTSGLAGGVLLGLMISRILENFFQFISKKVAAKKLT